MAAFKVSGRDISRRRVSAGGCERRIGKINQVDIGGGQAVRELPSKLGTQRGNGTEQEIIVVQVQPMDGLHCLILS
jgi:hypothetical protein